MTTSPLTNLRATDDGTLATDEAPAAGLLVAVSASGLVPWSPYHGGTSSFLAAAGVSLGQSQRLATPNHICQVMLAAGCESVQKGDALMVPQVGGPNTGLVLQAGQFFGVRDVSGFGASTPNLRTHAVALEDSPESAEPRLVRALYLGLGADGGSSPVPA